ncbi:MAG: tRNA (adenosine(37)-N6)-threonylcarbamoyltransferase complex dimerization subunit type 1 TsaB [Proteobacteria bacterium]|nr:tRNA (adenosine(37)-N6)-threonylcarbamoyltransferase complex dimerization subunit type 1 TsaB [Pseudomonadota bacterium]
MSIILALDSSGDVFSAALSTPRGAATPHTDYAYREQHGRAQAACALPLITDLLTKQNYTLEDCDAFAFAAGPGKFSALRLVCTLARSFAYAHNKPLLAVPSFAALAQANYGAQQLTVKCTLPAQQQHVYFAVCSNLAGTWQVDKTALHNCNLPLPAAAVQHACGAGYQSYPHILNQATLTTTAVYSNAAAVWQLAASMLANNEVSEPLTCKPFYLRDKIAETVYQRNARKHC